MCKRFLILFLLITGVAYGQASYDVINVNYKADNLNFTTGNGSKFFNLTLPGNVNTSALNGGSLGMEVIFNICQDVVGGHTFNWPPNVVNPPTISSGGLTCTSARFVNIGNFTWTIAGIGTGAANTPPGGNPIQTQVNNNGVFGGTPCESFGNISAGPANVDCDWHSKGPNPYVDITRFGARTCNPNTTPCASGITASINNGSTSATISSASTFINGDGVVIYGAGTSQSLTIPTGLAISSVVATMGTGTGLVTTGASGSTTKCYKIIARDTGGGFTAATTEVCNTTGQASLGAVTINLTSCSRSIATVTCTASSATPLLVGGAGPLLGEVYIGGSPTDSSFRGFHEATTAVDSTHFTFVDSAINTNTGATTGSTGGTATFYVANHLTWNAVTGAWLYYVYGGSSGAETLIGVSRPNQTVNGNTDTTFDDFGPGLMSNFTFPPWIPTSPPVSATNDNLSTTIVSGAGTTTLTLANSAGATVSGAGIRLDAGVAIASAAAVSSAVAPLYIPNDSSTNPFVVNNFVDLRSFRIAIYQSGSLFLNETLAVGLNSAPIGVFRWTGGQNTAFNTSGGGSGFGPLPNVLVKEASPGVYDGGGNQIFVDGIQFNYQGTNGALLFLVDGSGGAFNNTFNNGLFSTGTTSADLMGFGLYLRNMSGVFLMKEAMGAGNFGDGTSHNAPMYCFSCGDVHWPSGYLKGRGPIIWGGSAGGNIEIGNIHYNGGGTPLVSIANNVTATMGFTGDIPLMDTVGHQCVAMFGGKGGVIDNNCQPSGYTFASPAVTGPTQYVIGGGGIFSNSVILNSTSVTGTGRFSDGVAVVDEVFSGPGAITANSTDSIVVLNAAPLAPTCAVSAGGTVPIATWTFIVQPFWQGNLEGVQSPASTGCTTTTGNQTITINWTTIPGNPIGYHVFASSGTGYGSFNQCVALQTGTSCVISNANNGAPLLNTVPGGGPTMLLPGTQGVAAPTLVLNANGGFSSSLIAGTLTTNRTVSTPDVNGFIPTTSYQNSAYDNFNRANGAIGSNWTITKGTFAILSNQIQATTTGNNNDAFWNANTFSTSQFAQVTLSVVDFVNDNAGPTVYNSSGPNLYACTETATTMFIQKNIAGTESNLANTAVTGAVGDVLRVEIVLNSSIQPVITCFQNGVNKLSFTDTTSPFTGGNPGLKFAINNTTAQIDNWSGGNLHPIAQLDTEQDWTQPQHFTQPVTIGPTNPVAGALAPGLYSPRYTISGGAAPTCAVTGAGTGATCTLSSFSTDNSGAMQINSGTAPGSSGTWTLTFSAGFPNAAFCTVGPGSGGTVLNARATVFDNTNGTLGVHSGVWDNNGVAINASQSITFIISYVCGGH